jgi:hypothetical protein
VDETDAGVAAVGVAVVVFQNQHLEGLVGPLADFADGGQRVGGVGRHRHRPREHRRVRVAGGRNLHLAVARGGVQIATDGAEGHVFQHRVAVDVDVDVRRVRRHVGRTDRPGLHRLGGRLRAHVGAHLCACLGASLRTLAAGAGTPGQRDG